MDWSMGWTNDLATKDIWQNHVLKSYQLPQEYDHNDSRWAIYRTINEAVNLTQGDIQGPVHINVPLRD